MSDFEEKLAVLLNIYSAENASDTPDFILASYMHDALSAFNHTVQQREAWYGRKIEDTAVPAP